MGKRKREEKRQLREQKKKDRARKEKAKQQNDNNGIADPDLNQRKQDALLSNNFGEGAYKVLYLSNGGEIVLERRNVDENYNVFLSPERYVEKTAEEIVAGDHIKVVKPIQEVQNFELEDLIMQNIPIAQNAKNAFYVTLEGGYKVPALMYYLLKGYNHEKAEKLNLNLDNLDKAISENEIPIDKLRRIAEDIHEKSIVYARANDIVELKTPPYGWVGAASKDSRENEFNSTLRPQKAEYLRFLEQEINPDFKRYADAFLSEGDNDLHMLYNYLTNLKKKITKFMTKLSEIDLSELQTHENGDIESFIENNVEEIEWSAGVRKKVQMRNPEVQKKIMKYFRQFDFVPEIILMTDYLDTLEQQELLVRVQKTKNIKKSAAEKKEQFSKAAGRLMPNKEEKDFCMKTEFYELTKINALFNGIIDEVIVNYSLRRDLELDTLDVAGVTKVLSSYFGVNNVDYKFNTYVLGKNILPSSKMVFPIVEELNRSIFDGSLDIEFDVGQGTFQRLLETNTRVKNALPKLYWEADFLNCLSLNKGVEFIYDKLKSDEVYGKYIRKDMSEEIFSKAEKISKMGYQKERERLLSSLIVGLPLNDRALHQINMTPVLSVEISGYLNYYNARVESHFMAMSGDDLSSLIEGHGKEAEELISNIELIKQTVTVPYKKEHNIFNIMNRPELLSSLVPIFEGKGDYILSKSDVFSMLDEYNLSECGGLLHPNNFAFEIIKA